MKSIKNSYSKIVYLFSFFIFLFCFLLYFYSDIVFKNLIQIYANSLNSYKVEIGNLEKGSFDEYFLDNLNISSANSMDINIENILINFNFYNFIFNREIIESLYIDDLLINYKKPNKNTSSIKFPNLSINNIEIKNISILSDSSNHSFNIKTSLNIINNEVSIKIDSLISKTLLDKKIFITNTDFLMKNDTLFYNVNNAKLNTNILSFKGEFYKNKNQYDFSLDYINFQDLHNNSINVNLNKIQGRFDNNYNSINLNADYKISTSEKDIYAYSSLKIKNNTSSFNSNIYNDNLTINLEGDFNHLNKIWKLSSKIKKLKYSFLKDSVMLSGDIALFGNSNKIITSNINIESRSSNNDLAYNSIKAKINYKFGIFNSTGPIIFKNKNSNILITDLFFNFDSLNFNSDVSFNNYKLFLNENFSLYTNGLTSFNLSKVNDYYKFRVFIVICFFGQLFKVIEIILQQTGVEIFFMDWEKTRGKLANTKDAKGKAQQAPISAWRTFFVANEWNELQSQRRINVPFTIVTMLFFLVGCGWQYHATRTPKMDDLTPAPIDPMLRFVNVAGLWLVIELIQIIFLDMIWLRFFAEYPESQFKDMCVIAKVSVFIMDEKYHGYYLHCRSPHEHADANMMEIDKDLQKMREELTVSDTMQGVPTDGNDNPLFDTFEVSVTREWREHYDVLYRKLKSTIRNKTQNDKGNMAIKFKTRMDALSAEEEAKASANKFYNSSNNGNNNFSDSLADSDTESIVSISSRTHARAQSKLNAAILSVQRRTEREVLPKLERLTATTASAIHLGREVELAFKNELVKAEEWGKNGAAKASSSSSMDVYLLQSLCKSICKKDGRDALLEYVIQAIEDVEIGEGDIINDEEDDLNDEQNEEEI